MTLLILLLLLGVFGVAVYVRHRPPPGQPIDPQAAAKAAVDLHRIRRRIDVVQARHEQRQTAIQVQREIAEVLDDDAP